jgi:pSer/pThr/pTyr-binding forkhead associated (FHA) protein
MALTPEQADDERQADLEAFGIKGPALVVRSGGGRAGETFLLKRHATTIGRSPECDIFLDDVTVSRRHAIVAHKSGHLEIEDLGSLNGTYHNRRRIEAPERLDDGDELQIGKYRLTFLQ